MSEKGLAEKVLYAIYIDRPEEVEKRFNDYLDYVIIRAKKEDQKLFEKLFTKYAAYMEKKKMVNQL